MLVGLYTSRVVLNTLGVSDYGVYNVVGGVITMMSFLNAAMMGATQRFMAFELGRKNYDNLSRVFSNSISVYLIICLIAIIDFFDGAVRLNISSYAGSISAMVLSH